MKKFAIAASLVAALALGAFAKEKFFAQTTGFYKDATNACIAITLGSSKFQAVVGANPQATIKASNSANYPIYLNNIGGTCTTPAELIP